MRVTDLLLEQLDANRGDLDGVEVTAALVGLARMSFRMRFPPGDSFLTVRI